MKTILFIVLFFIPLLAQCIFPERKTTENSDSINNLISKYMLINDTSTLVPERLDYSQLDISKDSLDTKLYYLIDSHGEMTEELLIKNIENLIQRGANPNALVEITYSVRKVGTYIPIIRHFYRDKYNEYTTVTSPMHAAVGNGSVVVLEKMISLGGKTDILNQDKIYPIDIALKNNNEKIVDCLVKHGCKLQNANLSLSENTSLIERLVKLGANPKTIDINYALNKREELKRLLALKPSINNIQLDMEVLMKDDELFDLLLASGMSVNVKGKFPNECPILFAAVKYGNMRDFKILTEKGASISETCRSGFGETPLQVAIYYQQVEMLKLLLDMKVSPNEKDWTDKSALILACNSDNDEIINMLLDRGANIEYNGYFNKTPLLHAVQYKHYIAVETLIKRKANVNYRSKNGETALVKAIENNDYAMIKLLVESGADPKIKYESMNLAQYAGEKNAAPAVVNYLKKLIEQ